MRYINLSNSVNKPFITKNDMRLLGYDIFNYQYDLWQKKGYIIQLKRGLYLFSEYKDKITGFELSGSIYGPSYISLESALSHYGLIPEFVPSTTSVSAKNTRQFSNDAGTFYYRHIKPDLFWGYNSMAGQFGKYLLAEPEKAILDYIHLNIKSDNIEGAIDEIRINQDEFKHIIDRHKLRIYAKAYTSKKTVKAVNYLLKSISKAC